LQRARGSFNSAAEESLIRKPIKDLCDELDPSSFWQIHRSTIVNVHAIAGVVRDLRGHTQVRLSAGTSCLPSGVGLANIRARLTAQYGERATLQLEANSPRGVVATVRLPWTRGDERP
jgi:hypothetical protein